MIAIVRLLLVLLVVELGWCGYMVAQRLSRPVPVEPTFELRDSLLQKDLQVLIDQAKNGGSREWIELGEAYLGQGFYNHAEQCFRQAVELDPQSVLAQASYAFCLERTGRTEESTREYRRLSDFEPTSSIPIASRNYYLYAIGKNYLREENAEQAEALFRENSGFPPADYQLAKLLVRSGRSEEALPLIEANLKQIPDSLLFRLLQAQALEALGREEAALQAAHRAERSLHIVPLNFNTEYLTPLSKRHGIEKELDAYDSMTEWSDRDHLAEKLDDVLGQIEAQQTPQYKASLLNLVEIEYQRENPERMLEVLEKLNAFGVENAVTLQYRASAYMLQGKTELAVPLLERALKMSPTMELHQMLAEYYAEQGNEKERDFHLAQSALRLAMHHYQNNQLKAAEAAITDSVELDERDPRAWYYFAEIKRLQGDESAARTAYQKCLERNPNHGRAIRQLARMQPAE